jgi:hypothetical protein
VIYCEHLARLGKHAEAIETFTLLSDRGLPVFSSGLRLLFYAERIREPTKGILERLGLYIRAVDFQKTLTPFAGHSSHP